MKIIIDSGHGGRDSGAAAFGTNEKDLNLSFSKLLAEKLKNLKLDVDTSLINDTYYDSIQLTSLIKQSGASLCISCHNNAFNGTARGLEVIHSIYSNGILAGKILEEVSKTGFPVRKAYSRQSSTNPKDDFYFVIRLTHPQVETIIIEFGFMDNVEDFKLLTNPVWQDKLTSSVAAAVQDYVSTVNASIKTPIVGKTVLLQNQLKSALKDQNAKADTGLVDLYYGISPVYGIKPDLAFLQAMLETGWLKFTGVVKPQQNNFAGLGASGGGNPGDSFLTKEASIEAHIQHLYAYSTSGSLPQGRILYDPRFNFVLRGSAPNWEDLNGKWAVPGTGYGESVVKLQKAISAAYPPQQTAEPPPKPVHWAKTCNDELMSAGLLNNDHTDTLDDFATEGMVLCLVNRLRKELLKNG